MSKRDGRGKLVAYNVFEPTGRSDSIGTEKASVDQFDLAIAQAVDAADDFQFTLCDRDA